MPNQPQQGGMFARYAGTNMSPIPAGYMEAASQEANMYANIGNTVANMFMKKQEMGLKEKEIEATNRSATAKEGENKVKSAKDSADALLAGRKQDTADLVARAGILKDAQGALVGELNGVNLLINRHESGSEVLSDADLKRYKARKAQIMLDMESGNKQLADFMVRMAGKPAAEQAPTPSYFPGMGMPPFAQPKQGAGTPRTSPNFNEPSEPATGGTEGGEGRKVSGDAYRMAGIPVAVKAVNSTTPPPAENTPPAETSPPPPSATMQPETPVRTVFRSHLNTPVSTLPSLEVTDTKGVKSRAIGRFTSQKSESGVTMNPMLELNGEAFVFDSNGKLSLTKAFDKYTDRDKQDYLAQARMMHVMSWAINNHPDLLRRIDVLPEEKAAAEQFYINEGNRADYNNIVRAYAYASRDRRENVPMTWAQGELDRAFVNQFQVSTNEFTELGLDMFTANSASNWITQQTQASRERATTFSSNIKDLLSLRPQTSDILKNPYAEKIYKAQERVNRAVRNAEGIGGEFGQTARAEIASAQADLAGLQAASAAWENEKGVAAVKAKSEILEIQIRGGLDAELARMKDLETIRTSQDAALARMGETFQTWVGINPGDKERYFGYVASGVKNFKGYPTLIAGRPANLSAAEFRNWALRDPVNSSKVTGVSGLYAGQFPTLDTLTKPNVQDSVARSTGEMGKLIQPLKELHGLFSELNQMSGPTRVFNSAFNAKFAASEGLRATLVANIRTAFIGGGNPSNFEQEILRATVPDTGQLWTYTEFNLNRMRTLAIAVMLSHYRTMTANGMEMTEDSLEAYNREFSGILGRKMSMDDFKYFKSMTDKGNTEWQSVPTNAKADYGKQVGRNVFDQMTTAAIERFGDLEKKK